MLVHPTAYGFDHAALLDALARGEGRLRGVGVLPEGAGFADFETLHHAGVRALRFTELAAAGQPAPQAAPGRAGLTAFAALAGLMREFGWHAEFWMPAPRFVERADAVLGHGLTVVLDHMGYFGAPPNRDEAAYRAILPRLREGAVWLKLPLCRNSTEHGRYDDLRRFHDALVEAGPTTWSGAATGHSSGSTVPG